MALVDRISPLTVSSDYIRAMVGTLSEEGFSRGDCLSVLDVGDANLLDPRQRFSLDDVTKLFDTAERALRNPVIGLLAGYRFRVATFTETGSVLAYCPNLAAAAEMNGRYQALTETVGKSSLEREGNEAYLSWTPYYDADLKDKHRHVTELIFGGYAATIRWLAWSFGESAGRVDFRHSKPSAASHADYARILGEVPRFDASEHRIAFAPDTVDRPLPTYSEQKLDEVCRRLDLILFGDVSHQTTQPLRIALLSNLAEGQNSRAALAAASGLSVSELDSRLARQGMSFRSLLKSVRQEQAHLLIAQGVPLSQVALKLGYSDQPAFTRAFKGWNGLSPSEYRTML